MRQIAISIALFLGAASVAGAGPKGTVPKTSASDYSQHAEQNGMSIGATLASREQVRKAFVSDVNRCCTVVEVAVYPSKETGYAVSLNDFVLRVKGSEAADKPSSARVVAATLQKQAAKGHGVAVAPRGGVGYGSGDYDPTTGTTQGGGLYQQVIVGVSKSGPNPGSSDKDRSAMEVELSEKGLPEGPTTEPVAGYIYFPIAPKKGMTYQLEYTVDGQKVLLTLP